MDKLKMEARPMDEVLKKVAAICPAAVQDNKIDFERLKQELAPELDDSAESYNFTWVGKRDAIMGAATPIRKTLLPCKAESKNWDTTKNLYIEGDNLDVLKLLQESYLGKVKVCYIDSPYNTGNDFIYCDDFADNCEEYMEKKGQCDVETNERLFKNDESNGRFHSNWCTMMYSRLKVARDLLADDGVIFMSIDDHEVANLKKICDEIFGESNFVAQISVNRTSEVATSIMIQKVEYCLVYAKSFPAISIVGNKKYTISRGTVGNADQTMPEITFPAGLRCENISDGTYTSTRQLPNSMENITNLTPIIVENGKLKNDIVLKARWRSSNDMRNFFANGCEPTKAKINGVIEEIYFDGDRFMPYIKKLTTEKLSSLYLDNKRGSAELEKLGLDKFFDFPKSVSLLKDFIQLFAQEQDIVMDFFSGSATTAHAVMQLNAEDGGKRRFIMVQLPELCDEKSEAFKAGYKNICEIGKERIRRAGDKIVAETGKSDLDIGFKVLKLADSNMEDVYYNPADITQAGLLDKVDNVKKNRTELDLLYGVMLDLGLTLDLDVAEVKSGKTTYYNVDNGSLVACFADNIPESMIKEIAGLKPFRVVFKDSSFADAPAKINVTEIFKTMSPNTKITVL